MPENLDSCEDVCHRGVAAIENHVCVTDRRKVTSAIYEQDRDLRTALQKAMDDPAGWIGLLRMDENATDEGSLSVRGQARSFYAVANCDNAIRV